MDGIQYIVDLAAAPARVRGLLDAFTIQVFVISCVFTSLRIQFSVRHVVVRELDFGLSLLRNNN